MKSIHICYDEKDVGLFEKIKKMFEMENIACNDLYHADVHLFLFTDNADQSLKVIDELQNIILINKKILTLKYTNSLPSDELSFYIGASQWIDMFEEQSMKRLLDKILRQIR